jgi:glycosyltransferase involved in cell wall biosynthesis
MSPNLEVKVSVVMSCYNGAATITQAIESIVNQSFEHFELIIIDDGSTDQSKEIILQFCQKDQRIRLIENEVNIGLAASLNKGIQAAKSSFITRMDADDWAMPSRIEIQYQYMKDHQHIDILGTAMVQINKEGKEVGIISLPENHKDIVQRIFKKPLVYHPTIMIKKEIYARYGYYDESLRWAEDADLWYRIYDRVQFHNLPDVLLRYSIKERLNTKIIKNNLWVKYINLKRRNQLIKYIPILMKDWVIFNVKRVSNF